MKRNYCVYCHTNKINGKRYIGITNNVKRRWRTNGIEYKPDKNMNQNVAFWNAIQKYGWDNFDHEILVDNLTFDEAKQLERYYIHKYQTFIGYFDKREDRLGYNSTLGGEGTQGLKGELHPNYGKHLTDEQKSKLVDANSIAIDEYSIKGKFIKTWKSCKEACDYYSIDSKNMWELLNGKRISIHNKIFRYSGEPFNKYRTEHLDMSGKNHPMFNKRHTEESKNLMSKNRKGKCMANNNHHSHQVYCDGMIFPCIKQCSEYLNVKYQTLVSWLSGKNNMPQEYKNMNLMYYEKFIITQEGYNG